MSTLEQRRHPELDLLRTIAILLMVLYHGAYDLHAYYGWDLRVFEGGWRILARITASLFVGLAGVSFVVASQRHRSWQRRVRRAAQVLAAAALVSLATWIADPETYVRFGVLHLIGTGLLLLPLFMRFKEGNLLLGLLLIALGPWVADLQVDTSLMLPLGAIHPGFRSVDYFPILPWFGVMLLGYGVGYFFYVRKIRPVPVTSNQSLVTLFTWPGRHSLLIYLVHQPLLLGLLWTVNPVS